MPRDLPDGKPRGIQLLGTICSYQSSEDDAFFDKQNRTVGIRTDLPSYCNHTKLSCSAFKSGFLQSMVDHFA
ncbi:hypothetical protein OBV_11990 [Oscillibacter valericigenes Sjm18-20]|nr:hypothetical protein OBV_11990 [Oscillibacter valericigenes Sjm18-20]